MRIMQNTEQAVLESYISLTESYLQAWHGGKLPVDREAFLQRLVDVCAPASGERVLVEKYLREAVASVEKYHAANFVN